MAHVSLEKKAEELRREVSRLNVVEAAMHEWYEANQAEDQKRWLAGCRWVSTTLIGATWEATEPPQIQSQIQ